MMNNKFNSVFLLLICMIKVWSVSALAAPNDSSVRTERKTARKPAQYKVAQHNRVEAIPEDVLVKADSRKESAGGGMMRAEYAARSTQTVTKEFIDMKSPVSSAIDLIRTLPSVSVATTDTSGMQGGYIQIRGLTDGDMGLMLNGAPAQYAQYLAQNVDSENVENVSLTPGSSDTDLPTTTASAGVMNETTLTPSKKAGGFVDFSYGTNNLSREFIRLESGEIGKSGIRGYFSFSNTHARTWLGSGINTRKHIDFSLLKDWSNGSSNKLFLSWSHIIFPVDNYPTAEQFHEFKRTGEGYNHSKSFDPYNNNNWRNYIDNWNQVFITDQAHVVLTKKLALDIQPYLSNGSGWSGYPYGNSSGDDYQYANGQPVAAGQSLTSYYMQNYSTQVGAVAKLGYDIDRHNHIEFGYWYEKNSSQTLSPITATVSNGAAANPNNNNYALYNRDGSRAYDSPTQIAGYELHSLFIGDKASYFNNKLSVNAGFKLSMINYWQHGTDGSRYGSNNIAPAPHFSASYQFNNRHQIYITAEGNYRQPNPSNITLSTASSMLPRNQYTISEQLGYRYHDKYIIVDLSLFNYNITNRMLSTYLGNNEYGVMNVGNQTSRGFDLMVAGRPFHNFSPYASIEYLHATMDSNVPYGNSYMQTKGKNAIMSPHIMANFGLSYESQGFFGNFALHYTGPQSVTLVGDEHMPGFVTNSLTVGYHFKPFFYAKSPTLRLNFTNLTGSIVRTGVTGVASNAHAMTLLNGSTVSDTSPNTYLVEPRFSMTGTISTSF